MAKIASGAARFVRALPFLVALLAWHAVPAEAAGPVRPAHGCADPAGSVAGTVRAADGSAVGRAAVIAVDEQTGEVVEAGADGTYRFAALCDGRYEVYASAEGPDGPLVGYYDPDGDGVPDGVTLGPEGREATGIDIVVAPYEDPGWPTCDGGAGVVRGTVRGPDGQAYAGADVTVWSTDGSAAFAAVTGADGTYRAEGLCPGSYLVTASATSDTGWLDGMHDPDGDDVPNEVVLTADAPEAAGVDVTLEGLVWPEICTAGENEIAGRLTGAGREDVEVYAFSLTGSWGTAEVTGGTYRASGLCDGAYVLVAVAAGGEEILGFHDADRDGMPDFVAVGPDARSVDGVDIALGGPPARGGRTLCHVAARAGAEPFGARCAPGARARGARLPVVDPRRQAD